MRFGTTPGTARAHEHFRPRFGLLDFAPGVTELPVMVHLCAPAWQGGWGPGEKSPGPGGGEARAADLFFEIGLKKPVLEDSASFSSSSSSSFSSSSDLGIGSGVGGSVGPVGGAPLARVGLVQGAVRVSVRVLEPSHPPRVVGEVESPQLRNLLRSVNLRHAAAPLFDLGVRCLDDAVRKMFTSRAFVV